MELLQYNIFANAMGPIPDVYTLNQRNNYDNDNPDARYCLLARFMNIVHNIALITGKNSRWHSGQYRVYTYI